MGKILYTDIHKFLSILSLDKIMRTIQHLLVLNPLTLIGLLPLSNAVHAIEVMTHVNQTSGAVEVTNQKPVAILHNGNSMNSPQVPRGCTCSRCLESSQPLQGQFPTL